MSILELTFFPTVKSKGRNPFNADAIRTSLIDDGTRGKFVYLENRVASTGLYNMGFICVPADPEIINRMVDELKRIADSL